MKLDRSTWILFFAFIVLLASWQFWRLFTQQDSKGTSSQDYFFGFKIDDIQQVDVNHFVNGMRFKKIDGAWQIRKYKNQLAEKIENQNGEALQGIQTEFVPAKSSEMAKALSYFVEMPKLAPIAKENPDLKEFEINEYSLHVIFYDKNGNVLDKIYIGKHGPDVFSVYLKRASAPEVYLARQNFRDLIFRPYQDWLL